MEYTATRFIGKRVSPGCFWTNSPVVSTKAWRHLEWTVGWRQGRSPLLWQGDHGWCAKKTSRRFMLFFQVGDATFQNMVWEDKGPFNMNQLGGGFLVGEGQLVFVCQTVLDRPLPLARNSGWWSASYPDVTSIPTWMAGLKHLVLEDGVEDGLT